MKLDIPESLMFHGITFRRWFGGIYKSEELGEELYLDTAIMRLPTGDRVKVQILVNHLVSMESKHCKTYEEALKILEVKTKPFTKLIPKQTKPPITPLPSKGRLIR